MSQKINSTLALVFISVCLIFTPLLTQAQESVSFSVSPTIFDMTANPGQSWQSTLRIINANPFELVIYVDVVNFVPKGEAGVPRFVPIDPNNSQSVFAQWITTETKITIPPEQTTELPLKIEVPNDASPGGHYAAIMVSTKPQGSDGNENNVKTAQVISSLLFLRVTGDISEQSSIRSFRTADYLLSRPETDFEIRIENKGNVHVQPQGEIKIFNMWGQERGMVPINQQSLFGNVLPHSVRKYSFSWSSEWSVTDIGRYTAVATMAYGIDTRQFMTADTAFWVIPWKILIVFFGVIGGFIMLVSWAIKLYVQKMLLLAGVQTTMVPEVKTQVVSKVSRAKHVTAPLQAGVLDLKTRLNDTNSLTAWFETLMLFMKAYWKFFVAFFGVLLFIGLTIWFFKGAFTPEREFTVTINGVDAPHSESDTNNIVAPTKMGEGQPVSLVNRSGDTKALTVAIERLSKAGFIIAATSTEVGTPEEKSVVVYNPEHANQAVMISEVLNKALLSAFTSNSSSSPAVVVYIGTDILSPE